MRIDAQGKYMQTILEKACQTLTGKNGDCQNYNNNGVGNQGYMTNVGSMKDFSSSGNFPCLEDLNIYGDQRPNSKSPMIWSNNDMQLLQEVGTAAASCMPTTTQEDVFKR